MTFISEAFHTEWANTWASELQLTRSLQKLCPAPQLFRSVYSCSTNHREHLHHLMNHQPHQPEF